MAAYAEANPEAVCVKARSKAGHEPKRERIGIRENEGIARESMIEQIRLHCCPESAPTPRMSVLKLLRAMRRMREMPGVYVHRSFSAGEIWRGGWPAILAISL